MAPPARAAAGRAQRGDPEELGVDADERARLAAKHVIGDTPIG